MDQAEEKEWGDMSRPGWGERIAGLIQPDITDPNNAIDQAHKSAGPSARWALTLPRIARDSWPDLYLRSRGLGFSEYPPDLRMTKDGQHMMALIRGFTGEVVSYQRTILEPKSGGKWTKERKIMRNPPGYTIPAGSSIRLGRVSSRMGVAEGTESALSAFKRSGNAIVTWSAISANGLASWAPPVNIKTLFIFNDSGMVGEKAANKLRFTCHERGVMPLISRPEMLAMSDGRIVVADQNDLLRNSLARRKSKEQETCQLQMRR